MILKVRLGIFWETISKTKYILKDVLLHKKIKFSVKYFFSICELIRSLLRIWSHLLKNSLTENFIFLWELLVHLSDYSVLAAITDIEVLQNSCSQIFTTVLQFRWTLMTKEVSSRAVGLVTIQMVLNHGRGQAQQQCWRNIWEQEDQWNMANAGIFVVC